MSFLEEERLKTYNLEAKLRDSNSEILKNQIEDLKR
jgi:hypothetical protein